MIDFVFFFIGMLIGVKKERGNRQMRLHHVRNRDKCIAGFGRVSTRGAKEKEKDPN